MLHYCFFNIYDRIVDVINKGDTQNKIQILYIIAE